HPGFVDDVSASCIARELATATARPSPAPSFVAWLRARAPRSSRPLAACAPRASDEIVRVATGVGGAFDPQPPAALRAPPHAPVVTAVARAACGERDARAVTLLADHDERGSSGDARDAVGCFVLPRRVAIEVERSTSSLSSLKVVKEALRRGAPAGGGD